MGLVTEEDLADSGEERYLAQRERRLADIDVAIGRARLRQKLYVDRGDHASAKIEADVIDRRLRERFQVKPGDPSAADRWPAGRTA